MSDRRREDDRLLRDDGSGQDDRSARDDRSAYDARLQRLIEDWKTTTPGPPAGLEARILRTVRDARDAGDAREGGDSRDAHGGGGAREGGGAPEHERPAGVGGIPWYRPAAWPRPVWAAAGALAATLAIGSMMVMRAAIFAPTGPQQAQRLLVADALREAENIEREHAAAIARLEEITRPILIKADDPELPGAQAARLMALGNRLRFLDQTIAEINDFLRDNPGHAGVRTTLLAAYRDKTEVLRDVIAFDEEITS